MKKTETDIAIIGAGLTGLTLAHDLHKAGKDTLLIEKNNRVGGVIQTKTEQGFVYETGPSSGALNSIEMVNLFEELALDCSLETANASSKKRLILKNGKWQPLPSGLKSGVSTNLFTGRDKLGILLEPFRKKGTNPNETVGQLVLRRLGKSYLDYAVDPFISGIYGGEPSDLVTRFALPKLYQLEQNYGSFIGGAIKKKKQPKEPGEEKVTKEVFSVKGGLQNLIDALHNSLDKKKVNLSCENVTITPVDKHFEIRFKTKEEETLVIANQVVTTTGAYALPATLPFISKQHKEAFSNIKFATMTQVTLGYKHWSGMPLDAFGGLVPSKEEKNFLGVLFTSSIFSKRAPEGGAVLSCFIGGVKKIGHVNKTDEKILEIVNKEIKPLFKTSTEPDLTRIIRYQKAIPQYNIAMEDSLKAVEEIQAENPGLIIAGNVRNGIGMADRVKQARQIAKELISNNA